MNRLIFCILCCAASASFAMSEAEICKYRGMLVENFAMSRDAGKSEKQTAAEAKRELAKLGPAAGDMRSYIRLVYVRGDVTPSKFRLAAEVSCLQGN